MHHERKTKISPWYESVYWTAERKKLNGGRLEKAKNMETGHNGQNWGC